jgi:hypothetical protein
MVRRCVIALTVALTVGCSEESGGTTDRPTDGGVGPVACAAGEKPLQGGGCQPAGVRPDACAAGFEPDDARGCAPILPQAPCEPGMMAIPGETACREVAPCGRSAWGDIPVDAGTRHVDAAYLGATSDGSAAQPYITIGEAVAAADDDDVIAVAAGSYHEAVLVQGKRVHLWGRCPSMVEVVSSYGAPAIEIRSNADGTEVHTIAVRGPEAGIVSSGSQSILLDRLWVHDVGLNGVALIPDLGPSQMTIDGSLVEETDFDAVITGSSDLTVSRSVVRRTSGPVAWGINVYIRGDEDLPAKLTLVESVIEQSHEIGVVVNASQAIIEASVIQDIQPNSAGEGGRAMNVAHLPETAQPADVVVRTSVFRRNHDSQVSISGSVLTAESTTFRDTFPRLYDMGAGHGIACQNQVERCSLTLRESAITHTQEYGVMVAGSDALVESVYLADILPRVSDGFRGRGINVQWGTDEQVRGYATVRWSVLERTRETGLVIIGSDATVEATGIFATAPREADGTFGDGVAVLRTDTEPASVSLVDSRIESSARAGIASFGASVEVSSSRLECNAIDLDAEPLDGVPASFLDSGDVSCGCEGQERTCSVTSASLAPPEPLTEL